MRLAILALTLVLAGASKMPAQESLIPLATKSELEDILRAADCDELPPAPPPKKPRPRKPKKVVKLTATDAQLILEISKSMAEVPVAKAATPEPSKAPPPAQLATPKTTEP